MLACSAHARSIASLAQSALSCVTATALSVHASAKAPACLRTQLVPRVLLAGRQGGAAWRRDRQIVKQLGRRAATCSPRALRVHTVHTVCTLRAAAG